MIEFSLSEKLYTMIFRVARILRRCSERDTELPPGQLRLLALICALDVPTQQHVLEYMQIRPASLSEMMTKLEKGGYIIRGRDENDKRNVVITITEKGYAVNRKHYDTQRKQAIQAFEALSEEEKQQLYSIMKKLISEWEDK